LKYDLPQTQTYIDKYIRYQELYLRANKTSAEIAELQQLDNDLKDFMLKASEFNGKADQEVLNNLSNLVNALAGTGRTTETVKGNADAIASLSNVALKKSATPNTAGLFDTSTTNPTGTTRLNYSGYLYATKIYGIVFNDYAEYFLKDSNDLEAGDIIIKNPNGNGYIKSRYAYDELVVGVYSDTYWSCLGGDEEENIEERYIPVGLCGRVRVKVTGDIKKGDMLVASNIPGVAMSGNEYKWGTVTGKALEEHIGDSVDRIWMLIINN
jgi:hypothetical protein